MNANDRMSHTYLVYGGTPEDTFAKAREIAAQALCLSDGNRPCFACRACRKVSQEIHPDVIRIDRELNDKGKLKQSIAVDQIRRLAVDARILPNEGRCKVYIIPEAELMNIESQNAALKLFEEPPEWAVFILCAPSTEKLLETVRSRCVPVNCAGSETKYSEETQRLADGYIRVAAAQDRLETVKFCFKSEGMDGKAATSFASCVRDTLTDMLCGRAENPGLNDETALRLIALMERCLIYLRSNVGAKHIFGLLMAETVGGSGNRGQ